MKKFQIKMTLLYDIERVWDVVTSLDEWQWRSDLENIEKIDDTTFVEHSTDDISTIFKIDEVQTHKRYSFRLSNENIKGHWYGTFKACEQGCEVCFVEELEALNGLAKLMLPMYVKKQQKAYLKDLKRALEYR